MTDQEEIAEVLAEVLVEVGDERRCMMRFVMNVETIAKCPLGQVVRNQYTAPIVLKEKVAEMGVEEVLVEVIGEEAVVAVETRAWLN